ncbi:LacI family DNA-binding transcriptional regulator [Winslowiella iniecta]|uniref:LacI family transcriptional regulator n=1 Tax=Winslowiella iniecta TaxID=1560201 RepID=A0A0L7TCG9_9GAMM|nr:LacI family DNA-binding transcriptional regulator [Winslowiella iniecta]KOC90642.1 LacI family transcriptional regulator [Winslowiella iniecta]KOC93070.1 LacI family transcriptional regulator [Winslowiella iniecta]
MSKRRSSGRVTLQDVANYVGVGTMTVSRVMRNPEQVSEKLRAKVEQAAATLGYQPNNDASELASGKAKVTLADVAHHAGVGPMTVSRALRDPTQVSGESLKKIVAAVDELGYVVQQHASALASFQNSVAVLYPFFNDKPSITFLGALQDTLSKRQFQLIQACHEYNQHSESKVVEKLLQQRPAALVLFGAQLSSLTRTLIQNSGVLTINICSAEPFAADLTFNFAMSEAGEKLTRHLLEKGYKNIAFIGAHTDNRLQKQQINGWSKALLSHYHNTDLKITVPEAPDLKLGRYALGELLQTYPDIDAVICSHEEIALGVLYECQRRMLKVPYDLAVACLEGSENCEHSYPSLTAMQINYQKLGSQIGAAISAMIATPSGETAVQNLSYKLEVRLST